MSVTVCVLANTIAYSTGGGHRWAYLNWALSLRALGVRVIWLEIIDGKFSVDDLQKNIISLRRDLQHYGLDKDLALGPDPMADLVRCLDFQAATDADLLLNFRYNAPAEILAPFRRTALVDIDPGLLQVWVSNKWLSVAPHDCYFTIGETVGADSARFPDLGVEWRYAPPCVALDWWPVTPATSEAPFTTVTHWFGKEWIEENGFSYSNNKRDGFMPFLEVPRRVGQPMELAVCLAGDGAERAMLETNGWRVVESEQVTATPWDYRSYIQKSFGEFSAAKPSCVRLQNAWVSDRTLCYLASGKPAVVQHTGLSHFLPDEGGMLRFKTPSDATRQIQKVVSDYPWHCRRARMLAEEFFDGRKVVRHVLERALS